MKIRFDFVTNSSSSSFVAFNIKNKELVEVFKRFNIDYCILGDQICDETWFEESNAPKTPGKDSVAQWLAYYFELDEVKNLIGFYGDDSDVEGVVNYLREHAEEFDECIEKAEFEYGRAVTDGGGSSYGLEIHKEGKVQTSYLSGSDWDYKKYGETLASALSGSKEKIRELAIELNGFSEQYTSNNSFNEKISFDEFSKKRASMLKDIVVTLEPRIVDADKIFEGCNIARGDYWKDLPEMRGSGLGKMTPQELGRYRFQVLQDYIKDVLGVNLTRNASKKTDFIIFDDTDAYSTQYPDESIMIHWKSILEKCNKFPNLKVILKGNFDKYLYSAEHRI